MTLSCLSLRGTVTAMANIRAGRILNKRLRYGSFIERYPDYPSWLDGQTWELDIETEIEIHEPLNNFRSSLHYQARAFHLELATKATTDPETGRRVLLVQAFEPTAPQPQP